MNAFIEYALIDVDAEGLATVAVVALDAKVRHVLAAAVSAEADILLTENTAHFPADWMATHGIALLDSAALLRRLAETFPDKLLAAHLQTVRLSRKSMPRATTSPSASRQREDHGRSACARAGGPIPSPSASGLGAVLDA